MSNSLWRGVLCGLVLCAAQMATPCDAATAEPNERTVIQRNGWKYDRADLMWPSDTLREEAEKKGQIAGAPGWVDYDFEVQRAGWYELWSRGVPAEWQRDLYLDGKLEVRLLTNDPIKDKGGDQYKDANLYLAAGRHTLRYRRLDHPAILPIAWELREGQSRPEASLRIRSAVDSIVRVGQPIVCTVQGGCPVPAKYDFFLQVGGSDELVPAGTMEFAASSPPIERKLEFKLPRQGVWRIVVKIGEQPLRPADHKAPEFIAVDTAASPAADQPVKLTRVVEIDCVAQTINGEPVRPGENYFEQYGPTRIVQAPFGGYRTTNGRGQGGNWALDGFSYRINLPEAQALYKLEVDYPDDDRRTMGFWINDGAKLTTANGHVATGGVETGDIYPLSHRMQTHEAFFYPRSIDQMVLAVLNLTPAGMGAAASKVRIYRVQEPLPASIALETASPRVVGYWFEEPGRWMRHFGAENETPEEQLRSMDRWGQFARFQGARLLWPTINVYQANLWPSNVLEGYFSKPHNYMRLGAMIAERYGCQYVPEFHISGKNWFDSHRFGVTSVKTGNKAEVRFRTPDAEQHVLRSDTGAMQFAWQPFVFNALHPAVQQAYIDALGEAADTLKDCKSFKGISSRLMLAWMWQGYNALPSLRWGYDDWTIAQFEKETGITVPVDSKDAAKYRKRFEFLTGLRRQEWVQWRCRRIFEYHCRLRDRIRQAKPDANLYLTCIGLEPGFTLSRDPLEQMIESGIDPKLYEGVDGIVLVPSATFGRRYSTPSFDANVREKSFTDLFVRLARHGAGDRAASISSAYFEANDNVKWPNFGGKPYAAFDSCEPSAENERELFAAQLADADVSTFVVGANGTFAGRPAWMRPWFERFNAIPAGRFEKAPTRQDPVAVWQRKEDKGLVFYAVNRLPTSLTVSLGVTGADSVHIVAPGDPAVPLDATNAIRFTLEPYMLQVFRARGTSIALGPCKAEAPVEIVASRQQPLDFAIRLKEPLSERRIAAELSQQETAKAVAQIEKAAAAMNNGELAQARNLLFTPVLVRIYDSIGRYPPGLLERQTPLGYVDATDAPKTGPAQPVLAGGDPRGKLNTVSHLRFDGKGQLWVSAGPDLMQFAADGKYVRSLRLLDESDYLANGFRWDRMGPPVSMDLDHFAIAPDGDIVASGRNGALHRFESQWGRRKEGAGGRGSWAMLINGTGPNIAGVDEAGNVYVGDRKGIFKYQPDGSIRPEFENATTHRVTALASEAAAVDRAGRLFLARDTAVQLIEPNGAPGQTIDLPGKPTLIAISPDGMTAAAADRSTVWLLVRNDAGRWSIKTEAKAEGTITSVAVNNAGAVAVGLQTPINQATVLQFTPNGATLQKARPWVTASDAGAPAGPTPLKAWQGRLYYLARNRLMEINPAADQPAREAMNLSSLQKPVTGFAIDDAGDLYLSLAETAQGRKPAIVIAKATRTQDNWAAPVPVGPLPASVAESELPAMDLAAAGAGQLVLRVAAKRTGNTPPPRSLVRWNTRTGAVDTTTDLNPAEGDNMYGLCRAEDGRVFMADAAGRRIVCVGAEGQIAWQAAFMIHRSHGALPLRAPVAAALDRKGRVWVADAAANQIVCLDGRDGRFLTTLGHHGTIDDQTGGVFSPSGLSVLTDAQGQEWLYVADAGNRRIIRFAIRD